MFLKTIICCSLSWIAVLGLRISPKNNPITPLRLYFLIKLTPKSAGGIELFNGIDFAKSRDDFNRLLSLKTLYFQGFFNMSCRTMNLHRFIKMKDRLDESYRISFACLDNLPMFNEYGSAILKVLPEIIIDHLPSSSTYSEMVMKPLLKQSLYSTRLRSSIPICKALQMGSYLEYFAKNGDYWRMSDAYCLMAAPDLATPLLPDIYDINLKTDLIIDSLDKMIHTIAMVLTLNRSELRDEIRHRILNSILRTKLKKQQLFSRFVNIQSEMALIHDLLGSYLSKLVRISLLGMERDMWYEATAIFEPLLKVWSHSQSVRSKSVFGNPWGIRHNILMIFAEVLPDKKLVALAGKLKELLDNNLTQERVICTMFDILKARKSKNADFLIGIINTHLLKRGVQRPFKCRKPAGYGRSLPLKQDRMTILRRHAMEYASGFLVNTRSGRKYMVPESVNIDWMRGQVARKLTALVQQECFAVMDSTGKGPYLLINLASHPYKTTLFWELLTLSSSLRLKMPFEIHPVLALAYLEGSEESMNELFNLLTITEFSKNEPTDAKLQRALQIEAYACFRSNGWKFNAPTKKSLRYYEGQLSVMSLQFRPASMMPPIRAILDTYYYYWRQNFAFCEIEDLAPVAENHLDLAGYLVNPDISK